jgi:hypothetical protein
MAGSAAANSATFGLSRIPSDYKLLAPELSSYQKDQPKNLPIGVFGIQQQYIKYSLGINANMESQEQQMRSRLPFFPKSKKTK